MNSVYIYNANRDKMFSSLLMNDLNIRGVSFSNLQLTKVINPNNILIYIPRVGIGDNGLSDIVPSLGTVEYDIAKFKMRIIPLIRYNDYSNVRLMFNGRFGERGFKYYQGIGFDTLYSRIVSSECHRILRNNRKPYSI